MKLVKTEDGQEVKLLQHFVRGDRTDQGFKYARTEAWALCERVWRRSTVRILQKLTKDLRVYYSLPKSPW